MANILGFECRNAAKLIPTSPNVCPEDGGPLYVRYDLDAIRQHATREWRDADQHVALLRRAA